MGEIARLAPAVTRHRRIHQIADRVARAEREFVELYKPKNLSRKGRRPSFYTKAPRRGVYGASVEIKFAATVEELEIPTDCDFGDAGFGLGGICFAAGLYFDRVIGYELDIRLIRAAQQLHDELDFNDNVSFAYRDFKRMRPPRRSLRNLLLYPAYQKV